jgi:hypothetical protein
MIAQFSPAFTETIIELARKYKFRAIAATCADGRPSFEQLKMNGMLA